MEAEVDVVLEVGLEVGLEVELEVDVEVEAAVTAGAVVAAAAVTAAVEVEVGVGEGLTLGVVRFRVDVGVVVEVGLEVDTEVKAEVEVVRETCSLWSPGMVRDVQASHALRWKHSSHLCRLQLSRRHRPLAYLAMARVGTGEVRRLQETQVATSSELSSVALSEVQPSHNEERQPQTPAGPWVQEGQALEFAG